VERILITGGSSYLGRHLAPIASEKFYVCYTYHNHDPLGGQGSNLDIRDGQAVRQLVVACQPSTIIHLAGSDRSPDMDNVIRLGARHICDSAASSGAKLIHLSSDVIFDGRHAPYDENARPDPVHAYGRAKAAAESIIAGYDNHLIIRTSLIYGLDIIDHSTEWVTTALSRGQPVRLYDNQIRNPIWVGTLSRALLECMALPYRGILNVAGRQSLSRADYGLRMLDWWGVTGREGLTVGPSDARWPLDCRLDISLAESLLAMELLGVDEVLEEGYKNRRRER